MPWEESLPLPCLSFWGQRRMKTRAARSDRSQPHASTPPRTHMPLISLAVQGPMATGLKSGLGSAYSARDERMASATIPWST